MLLEFGKLTMILPIAETILDRNGTRVIYLGMMVRVRGCPPNAIFGPCAVANIAKT